MTTMLPLPQLVGVTVTSAGPIRQAHLELNRGLTVVYGRNGVGKSQLLAGIGRVVSGDSNWGSSLYVRWPWPAAETPAKQSPALWDWYGTRGNPWFHSDDPKFLDSGVMGPSMSVALEDSARIAPSLRELPRRHQGLIDRMVIGLENVPYEEPEIQRVVAIAAEAAEFGLFNYTRGGAAAVLLHNEDFPLGRQMWGELLGHRSEELKRDGRTSKMLIDVTQSLGLGNLGFWFNSVDERLSELYPGSEGEHEHTWPNPQLASPWWVGDVTEHFPVSGAPCTLMVESAADPAETTLDHLESILEGSTGLLAADTSALHPDLDHRVAELSESASRHFATLLEAAPALECRVRPIHEWTRSAPVDWVATDPSGAIVALDDLSNAQSRWARFAIQLALFGESSDELPVLVLLDEPEAALHRRAERHLLAGLTQIAAELGATLVVATHSPEFLAACEAQLVHLDRDASGHSVTRPLPGSLRDRIDELGLSPADLLQLCRTVVLVEGQHELVIFDELFRDELAAAGAELFTTRGAKNLASAADAQLLFDYTDARVLVVVDNEDADRVTDIWSRAQQAAANGLDPLPVLEELTKVKTSEAKFLKDFCKKVLDAGTNHRVDFHPLSLPDVPEYLPVSPIVPDSPDGKSWADYRAEYEKLDTKKAFKSWMEKAHGAAYDDETLRAAAGRLDEYHPDLVALLNAIVAPPRLRMP